ncbi:MULTISPECIES: hypothetical protein [Acinetobacter calcoaceticus/baumannii complex]|uniref:hypothetical protein n=1 Tax=Acinetobacter calcoaceticus/baumannii complex TaxID=909768 RepID=UPI0008DC8393|nr:MULTISPECIES: hypothetical protein [Acinetobacter calcoaceticus/baumannii complex]MDA3319791.1 hypothetical protein [Acinetobacter baumannii]MDA3435575.1 hypothetical protein [Acinetobacter baumannii]MDA3498436.1 hypothetical protein [Acinetobacter baumannii]MDN8150349.1 hypothetical protein [Acinetobacter baumannii]MDQ9030618.1 hypothetical protein [Acinetobacter nosocomialis]
MNMLANISFDAAVFTSLEVMNVGVEDGVVQFSLSVQNAEHIYIVASVKGIEKNDTFEYGEGLDYQDWKDVEYTMMTVDSSSRPHVDEYNYVDAVEGMPFALTSTQILKLNEYLEELAREEKITELRGG